MATSGTTSFTLDLLEVVEEAFERCGSEPRNGYDLRTARRSINLLFADWSNRGINFWTIDSVTVPLIANQASYTLAADTIDVLDCVYRTNPGVAAQNDRILNRQSMAVYAAIPNKMASGAPYQMTVDRQRDAPVVTLFPIPTDATAVMVCWRLRRMQDVTGGTDTADLPFRFLPSFASGLSYYLSLKIPGAQDRTQTLKAAYDEDWNNATAEDRDRSTLRIVPRIGRM